MKPDRKAVIAELWRRGLLTYKLDACQKQLYDLYHNGKDKLNVWLLARRSGKSYTLIVLALELCNRVPGAIVKYLAPTKLQVNNIIRPLIKTLLKDCPEHLKPEFKQKEYIYYFPNGSELQLAGSDNGHAEKLRGGDSHLAIVDEAGSTKDLKYIVDSILLPTTLITKGKVLLASTPPRESDHDFLKYIERADKNKCLIKYTIDDNPRITPAERQELIEELGGLHTDAARRELYCEIVKDPTTCVVPELTDALEKEIVKEWPRPPFFDAYVAMDLGFKDLTAALFGYFDYRADKIIIEDELAIDFAQPGNNLKTLSQLIDQKEQKLWTNPMTAEVKRPCVRVSDINYIVTQEIAIASNGTITFIPTKKDEKAAAINTMKLMLAAKKIIIHPRCEQLLNHLRHCKWASTNQVTTQFVRSDEGHHYDFVDALVYFVRSVAFKKNPYPPGYDLNLKDLYVYNQEKFAQRNQAEQYYKIFGMKRPQSRKP